MFSCKCNCLNGHDLSLLSFLFPSFDSICIVAHTNKWRYIVGIKLPISFFLYAFKSTQLIWGHFSFWNMIHQRDFYSEKRDKFTIGHSIGQKPSSLFVTNTNGHPWPCQLWNWWRRYISHLYGVIGTRCDPHKYKALTDKIKAVLGYVLHLRTYFECTKKLLRC